VYAIIAFLSLPITITLLSKNCVYLLVFAQINLASFFYGAFQQLFAVGQCCFKHCQPSPHMSFARDMSVCLRSSFGALLATSAANLMLPEPVTDKVNFDGNLVLIDRQDGSCSYS
jgi:hypothetical protein